jgi:hypothetical protein
MTSAVCRADGMIIISKIDNFLICGITSLHTESCPELILSILTRFNEYKHYIILYIHNNYDTTHDSDII